MPRECPTCSTYLRGDSCSACGWSEVRSTSVAVRNNRWGYCEHTDRGAQCSAPGTISRTTTGPHHWFCFRHAFPNSSGPREAKPQGMQPFSAANTFKLPA